MIFAGGGTGGHLYPGLAVADRLREDGDEVLFLGTRRGVEARVVPEWGYPIAFVRACGLALSPLRLLKFIGTTLIGTIESLRWMRDFRPHLVVGTGGYVSAPAVLAARCLGVPVVLLEQNALPGKANRLLGRLARRVCVSFPDSVTHFSGCPTEVTGNPVRRELLAVDRQTAREALDIPLHRPCLMITGASQGAQSLNRATARALLRWRQQPWTILHLTGRAAYDEVRKEADKLIGPDDALDYRPFAYRDDIGQLYGCADLVLSRAGATTIAELTCLGLPAILVPYPHAGGHQRLNAAAMQREGAATLVDDDKIEDSLTDLVNQLFTDRDRLDRMASASRSLGTPEASERIATICKEFSR